MPEVGVAYAGRRSRRRPAGRLDQRVRRTRDLVARCPAYRGCERLRETSGPSRGCGSSRTHAQRRARMYLHANAKLGLAGRLRAGPRDRGWSFAEGGRGRLQRLGGDRSSLVASLARGRPPGKLVCSTARAGRAARRGCSRELQERICDCRRKTGWGPRLVAGATGFAHSTVWKVLNRVPLAPPGDGEGAREQLRVAVSRRPAAHGRQPLRAVRASRLGPHRRALPGRTPLMRPETRVGFDYAHAIVDDHSRLAYVEAPRQRSRSNRHRLRRARSRT